MAPDRDLLELERQGWTALTKGGDAAADFYDQVLASEVLDAAPWRHGVDTTALRRST